MGLSRDGHPFGPLFFPDVDSRKRQTADIVLAFSVSILWHCLLELLFNTAPTWFQKMFAVSLRLDVPAHCLVDLYCLVRLVLPVRAEDILFRCVGLLLQFLHTHIQAFIRPHSRPYTKGIPRMTSRVCCMLGYTTSRRGFVHDPVCLCDIHPGPWGAACSAPPPLGLQLRHRSQPCWPKSWFCRFPENVTDTLE